MKDIKGEYSSTSNFPNAFIGGEYSNTVNMKPTIAIKGNPTDLNNPDNYEVISLEEEIEKQWIKKN